MTDPAPVGDPKRPPSTLRKAGTIAVVLVVVVALVVIYSRQRSAGGGYVKHRGLWTGGGIPYQFVITPGEASGEALAQAVVDAEAALEAVDESMSTFRPASPLSLLNAAGADEPVELPPELVEVLSRARRISRLSGGAFDPTARPVFQAWSAALDEHRLPAPSALTEARAASGWERFTFADASAVKAAPAAQIDLSAIAKGYAVDRALAAIRAAGAAGAQVEVGGEVGLFGPAPTGPRWPVYIVNPFAPDAEPLGPILLTDAAVATSGDYRQYTEIDGVRYGHIIDPRTEAPAETTASATVIAPDCTTADAWATALAVLGEEGLALVRGIDGVQAMLILGPAENPRAVMTDGFEALLAEDAIIPGR